MTVKRDDSILDTPELPLHLGGARRFDPDGGASAEDGAHLSLLTEMCSGDWSWKPMRDKAYRKDDGPVFRTFTGVPPSMAEQLANERSKPRAQFGTPPHVDAESTADFQWRCKAAHKTAGDYTYHNPRAT